ncbi:alpha/beta fold hydrolase [Allonocardiopsis opalescens]|uniref:Pimeloyl-ACP methyl ester carboxylesterase n=1 Tax=Allonocardiopsis opalescens TaxID=1144618 RepID=A0A2T0QFL5_9ACTN|nr:alpha/beta hydrolase [Allonocardiopsis opalescens]PRY02718.1 pimeloyl-ACP methyl ester carboxylesterase [Allonocardiopsis opalescens]
MFLHAGIADRRMWRAQPAEFGGPCRAIAVDLRGFGDSSDAAGPFSRTGDLLALLDALEIDRATLVACSFSGAAAIEVAPDHRDRVTRLALSGSALPGRDWSARLDALFAAELGDGDPEDVDTVAPAETRLWPAVSARGEDAVGPEVFALTREMNRAALAREVALGDTAREVPPDPSLASRLGELAAPALVAVGEHDLPGIRDNARALAAGIGGAELVVIPGAAHLAPLENPGAFNCALGALRAR